MPDRTINANADSSNANAYADIAWADGWLLYATDASTWNSSATTDDDKANALVTATRLLDSVCNWKGQKVTASQPLEFPRSGIVDRNGFLIDDDIFPEQVKRATSELANYLINNSGDTGLNKEGEGTENIAEIKVGSIGVKFKDPQQIEETALPNSVLAWIDELMTLTGVGDNQQVSYGTVHRG